LFRRTHASTCDRVDYVNSYTGNVTRLTNDEILTFAGSLVIVLSQLTCFGNSGRALALAFVGIQLLRRNAAQLANREYFYTSACQIVPSLTSGTNKGLTVSHALAVVKVLLSIKGALFLEAFATACFLVEVLVGGTLETLRTAALTNRVVEPCQGLVAGTFVSAFALAGLSVVERERSFAVVAVVLILLYGEDQSGGRVGMSISNFNGEIVFAAGDSDVEDVVLIPVVSVADVGSIEPYSELIVSSDA